MATSYPLSARKSRCGSSSSASSSTHNTDLGGCPSFAGSGISRMYLRPLRLPSGDAPLDSAFVPTSPPFALAAPGFPLRSLAALASRAALGGPREVLLAAMQAARMVEGAAGPHPLPESLRRARANAARAWLAALALPNTSRLTIARAIELSAGGE